MMISVFVSHSFLPCERNDDFSMVKNCDLQIQMAMGISSPGCAVFLSHMENKSVKVSRQINKALVAKWHNMQISKRWIC